MRELQTLEPVVRAFFESFVKKGGPVPVQPRINVPPNPTTGRFQRQLPVDREVPAGTLPRRAQYPQAPDVTPVGPRRGPGIPQAPGQMVLPIREALSTPGTTITGRSSALATSSPQAPVPAWVPQSQAAQQLLSTDPGTYRSILDISNKASDAYGIPAAEIFDNLVGPRGIDYLRALEYGEPGALVRQGSSAMTKGGSGGGAAGALARTKGEVPGSITRSPGGEVTDPIIERVRIEDITRGGAMTPAQTEALTSLASRPLMGGDAVTAMGARNAVGGTRQADLSNLYKAAAGLAGVGGLGIALDQYERGQSEQRADQIKQDMIGFLTDTLGPESPMGPTTADPEVGAKIPAVTGGNPAAQIPSPLGTPNLPNTANPPAPEAMEPAMRAMPQPGMMGGGQVVIRTNDGESNYRQAAANAQAQGAGRLGSGARGMYAVERAAAMKAGQPAATIEALKGMGAPGSVGIETDAAFEQWAKANPVLAYRLMEQRRTLPSQQMPVAKQTEITSEAGTNVNKLVEGSMKMGMEDPAGQFQGSADLRQFMAPRSAAYIGQPPINMYR
jgi:hypothetical protein